MKVTRCNMDAAHLAHRALKKIRRPLRKAKAKARLHPLLHLPKPMKGVLVWHWDLETKAKALVREGVKEKAKLEAKTKAGA